MKRLPLLIAVFVLGTLADAAPITRDLGQGLPYFRSGSLPADLPADAVATPKGCVLDLRYAQGESDSGAALAAWLKRRATPRTPVLVLANAATAPALRAVLGPHDPAGGVIVIGVAGADFAPDLEVAMSAADERRAYDALAEGVSLAVLLTDNPDKVRNDEASLSKDRLAEASADAVTEAKKPAPPPVDAVLQRAVHIHRGWAALKKI